MGSSKPADIVMYRTQFCGYCLRAARLLSQKGAKVREIDVSDDPPTRRWLREVTRQSTVPQIFINGVSVGGYDEIAALERQGNLDSLLLAELDAAAREP